MHKSKLFPIMLGLIFLFSTALSGCSGKGISGIFGGKGSGTTMISGKVTLSSSILSSGKAAQMKAMYGTPVGKPGSKAYQKQAAKVVETGISDILLAPLAASSLAYATVDLYDADHPEWLFPIASGTTASDGSYSLSAMINGEKNIGAVYTNGDPIPAGKYTLVAYKGGLGQKPMVAVQTLVKNFDGSVPNVDFEVLPSDVAPMVISMFGTKKNTDGTQTWGSANTTLAANAAIQITFSMPMVREALAAIDIKSPDSGTVPTGKWTLSADWLTATYYFDAGQQMTQNDRYTVTIYGADDTSQIHGKVTNVYGNPIDYTAVGTFTATADDTFSPTVQWNSPSVIQMGSPVDVTQAFRIEASEMMDVNGITLEGTPSIGVKPGVLYLGKNTAGMYVYEFVLGEPLMLGTSYSLRVYGGKDLSGNQMNALTGSIRTNDAADTPGILCLDANGNPATSGSVCFDDSHNPVSIDYQNMEAQVKAVFGKWVRAMNDRNLAQFQGLMTGDFYMEYDPTRGIDANTDVNRDGRYSFAEFSNMIANRSFPQWEYCGTTLTGNVINTINVVSATNTGDFEFTLTASNLVNSQSCSEAAPKEHLYATLKYANGAWKIVRASSGIDTRDKPISNADLIPNSILYQATGMLSLSSKAINDGDNLDDVPNSYGATNNTSNLIAKFTWDAVAGVSSYVLIVVDARDPQRGMAVSFPNTVTSARSDKRWVEDLNGVDVGQKFGFNANNPLQYVKGGRYYWMVIGLGTATTTPADPNNPGNDPNYVVNKGVSAILKDITATSTAKHFGISGTFADLEVLVSKGTNTATTVSFSEVLGGYDVGSSYQVSLQAATPNQNAWNGQGYIMLSGSSQKSYILAFDGSGMGTVLDSMTFQPKAITLFKGWNDVTLCDNGMPPACSGLRKEFGILTSGGILPVINIWDVTDDTGNPLQGDVWNYYNATTGAKKVTITGAVSDTMITTLYVNVRNNIGGYNFTTTSIDPSDHTYAVTLDIYQGTNWISLTDQPGGTQNMGNRTYLGVYTDTGTPWVPPILITSITDASTDNTPGLADKTADYQNSSDWTASPGADHVVTILGKLKDTTQPAQYNVWSEGAGMWGQISYLQDGSFSIPVLLYNGWNNVSINQNGNWYGVNIYTTTGKPVIKPMITNINNSNFDPVASGGMYSTNTCMITISGTAEAGNINVNWNGYDGSTYGSEYYDLTAAGDNTFTVTLPVVGGPGSYNYVNVYDKNWKSTSLTVKGPAAGCGYQNPSLSVSQVTANLAGTVTPDVNGYYNVSGSQTVTISGTANANRFNALTNIGSTITAKLYLCNGDQRYVTTMSSNGTWSIGPIDVYGSLGVNSIYVTDGYSSWSIPVSGADASHMPPPPPLYVTDVLSGTTTLTATSSGCQNSSYDATSLSTNATTVSITATTSAQAGTGTYFDPLGVAHKFQITGSSFTIPNVDVYDGQNDIGIYDAAWNWYGVTIFTANSVPRPHFVEITDPVHNQSVSGLYTVRGKAGNAGSSTFTPTEVDAYIYDSNMGWSTYFSNLPGKEPLNFANGNFNFQYDFGNYTIPSYSEIYVCAYDNTIGMGHCHDEYVNNINNWSQGYNKPVTKTTNLDLRRKINKAEFQKRFLLMR